MTSPRRIIVTGGAGFIGSALVRHLIRETPHHVLNIDKLTYAGNLESLREIADDPRYTFLHADIADPAIAEAFATFAPDTVMNLAAESHVDRSIDNSADFLHTNILGTANLLDVSRHYLASRPETERRRFRFHHISTDEVYGSLAPHAPAFTEESPYAPHSPYAASKAASDHLVRAWHSTYGLPILLTNCANNYGPFHFPEKLIPLTILNALEGKPLSIYGDGMQVRDWLYVEDHVRALLQVVTHGTPGESYNIGAECEKTNLNVVHKLCDLLDELVPKPISYREQIVHVTDRPGHDRRYVLDTHKLRTELNWQAATDFDVGLRATVRWYLNNEWWWRPLRERVYHGERLGIISN